MAGQPTETVYGLAGNDYSKKAVKTIFRLKKRPKRNPLITKETAISSRRKAYYSNEKIKNALGYNFIKINSSIKKYCKFFIDDLD